MTPADRRAAVVREALAVVGLGAHDPEAYLDLVGPGESPEARRAMLTMSGCALVAAGVLRRAGLEAPELAPPYRSQSAVSRLEALARRCGAWRVTTGPDAGSPSAGDIVIVSGPWHVFVPTSLVYSAPDSATGIPLASVDGGQLDKQERQIVKARQRRWTATRFGWRDRASDDGVRFGGPRVVYGWIDVGALPIASQAERDEAEVYG